MDSVRLDLWLWAARFFKTRALAKQAIETGKVEVGGQRAKPARAVPGGCVVVIDEAYAEFRRTGVPSAATIIPEHPNLAVSRTMSKAFALAGGRLGYLVAHQPLIDALRVVRGEEVFEVQVAALSDTRGPARVAQALYSESEQSREARLERLARLRAERAGYRPPGQRPDKRARRLIRALGDIDAS